MLCDLSPGPIFLYSYFHVWVDLTPKRNKLKASSRD